MRAAAIGRPSSRLGKKHTPETRAKISRMTRLKALRGSACPAYIDGRSAERRGYRFTAEYKQWRFDVYSRDRFTCQHCGDARGGNLVAHHIKSYAKYPALRLVVSNGITLCETCHDQGHYGKVRVKTGRSRSGKH